jgi:hypothetical protein
VFHYIQLEEGEIATEYEPYGYKIPVTASGRNLFDESLLLENTSRVTKVDDGYKVSAYPAIWGSTDALVTHLKKVLKPDVTYTCFRKITRDAHLTASEGAIRIRSASGNIASITVEKPLTFTLTQEQIDSISSVYIYGSGNGSVVFHQILIAEGDTTTEYEPYVEPATTNIYLDEPLRKLGKYADYIDFTEGKSYRYSAVKYLTKDLKYSYGTTPNSGGMYQNSHSLTGTMEAGTQTPGYCNTLPTNKQYWNSWKCPQIHLGQNNAGVYIISDRQITSAEDMYNYLSNNGEVEPYIIYIQGNGDKIVEPVEEKLQLPNLPTFKGTTIYEINTTTQPSNMAVEYYSTTKGV